jgi:hypothetical protein
MKLRIGQYAPSSKFTGIAISLLLAGGLVYAANWVTHPHASTAAIVSEQTAQPRDSTDWEAALYASQAANASSSLVAPSTDVVNKFLAAAKSSNLTDTVARTMLINITNAKSQGLGDDVPTQDQIIATAAAQVASEQPSANNYAYSDLVIVPSSKSTLHTFGNSVMQALSTHPAASEQATLLAIDEIVEGGDKSKASTLVTIGASYKAIATDLIKIPVPQTLAPLYLQAINNFVATAATYTNIQTVGTDSVRGLSGMQAYENLMDANARVFTNIAEGLQKDGILFTKDEPGQSWSVLLPPTPGSQ